MHTDRLLKLASLLEADAANPKGIQFDLGVWAGPSGHPKLRFDSIPTTVPVSCATTACAMGLACLSGAFADDGLTHFFKDGGWADGTRVLIPMCEGEEGFEAAQVLFDITEDAAHQLFDMDYYNGTKGAKAELEVAGRIRELVARS